MMQMRNIDRVNTLGAGVDWLTITTVEGEQTTAMMKTAREFVAETCSETAIPKQWKAMGYVGQSYGAVKFGRRKADEGILILSSDAAEEFGVNFEVPSNRVTRCDLQVTIALNEPKPDLVWKLHQTLTSPEKAAIIKSPLKFIRSETGDTLYIGNRTAEVSLRLYDKSSWYNNAEPGSIWRYEVEYKKRRAKSAVSIVQRAQARYTTIAAMVFDEFNRKHVTPLYEKGDIDVAMETQVAISTVDGKLSWLERCVAPVVSQLIKLGYERQVIENLRLRGVYREGE